MLKHVIWMLSLDLRPARVPQSLIRPNTYYHNDQSVGAGDPQLCILHCLTKQIKNASFTLYCCHLKVTMTIIGNLSFSQKSSWNSAYNVKITYTGKNESPCGRQGPICYFICDMFDHIGCTKKLWKPGDIGFWKIWKRCFFQDILNAFW